MKLQFFAPDSKSLSAESTPSALLIEFVAIIMSLYENDCNELSYFSTDAPHLTFIHVPSILCFLCTDSVATLHSLTISLIGAVKLYKCQIIQGHIQHFSSSVIKNANELQKNLIHIICPGILTQLREILISEWIR